VKEKTMAGIPETRDMTETILASYEIERERHVVSLRHQGTALVLQELTSGPFTHMKYGMDEHARHVVIREGSAEALVHEAFLQGISTLADLRDLLAARGIPFDWMDTGPDASAICVPSSAPALYL